MEESLLNAEKKHAVEFLSFERMKFIMSFKTEFE